MTAILLGNQHKDNARLASYRVPQSDFHNVPRKRIATLLQGDTLAEC